MNKLVSVLLLLTSVMLVSGVQAKPEDEFYEDMNQMCAETNTKSSTVFITSCYQYIRGFLQGAVITDTAIMERVNNGAGQSSYENKAEEMEQSKMPVTLYAGFCLPEDNVTHEVVLDLLKSVQERFLAASDIPENPLSEHLYALLKQRYPCKGDGEVNPESHSK